MVNSIWNNYMTGLLSAFYFSVIESLMPHGILTYRLMVKIIIKS